MTLGRPDPDMLAAGAASSLALTADAFGQTAAPDYWTWSAGAHRDVVQALAELPEPRVPILVARLQHDPADGAAYRELRSLIAVKLRSGGAEAGKLAQLVWDAECLSRLRFHVGDRWRPGGPRADTERVLARLRPARTGHQDRVDAAVVIPFRERDPDGSRVRNLAAVLAALNDQSHPRDRYRLVVVETDDRPRWRDLLAGACDAYLFAANPGAFNKSWAVNVGVVHGARPADLICVLDGDILVDRGFVERAVTRFRVPGTQAHWPFTDMLFADADSSHQAVAARCLDGRPEVDADALRGVFLRRPPGGCLWLRESLFTRIGGMDERFRGWGGEDMDLVWRAELHGPMDRYDDPILHLDHRRAPHRADDGVSFQEFYDTIRWCSWPRDAQFGDLDRYAGSELPA